MGNRQSKKVNNNTSYSPWSVLPNPPRTILNGCVAKINNNQIIIASSNKYPSEQPGIYIHTLNSIKWEFICNYPSYIRDVYNIIYDESSGRLYLEVWSEYLGPMNTGKHEMLSFDLNTKEFDLVSRSIGSDQAKCMIKVENRIHLIVKDGIHYIFDIPSNKAANFSVNEFDELTNCIGVYIPSQKEILLIVEKGIPGLLFVGIYKFSLLHHKWRLIATCSQVSYCFSSALLMQDEGLIILGPDERFDDIWVYDIVHNDLRKSNVDALRHSDVGSAKPHFRQFVGIAVDGDKCVSGYIRKYCQEMNMEMISQDVMGVLLRFYSEESIYCIASVGKRNNPRKQLIMYSAISLYNIL